MNKSKSLEQILLDLQDHFATEFGVRDAVNKIGIEPKAWDLLMQKLNSSESRKYSVRMTDLVEPQVYGIILVPRKRENF